jgi:D-arabinose 1-dehydrogenase-like Zn-dependent alcohol dehydrogenase
MLSAYQVTAFGQPLQLVEKPLPVPREGEVLVTVEACGVCHSDLHIWEGHFDLGGGKKLPLLGGGKDLPITLGHEIIGTVTAVGPGVTGVAVSQRRLVFPWIGCGTCAVCKAGEEHICQGRAKALGVFIDGGYASHVLVPHERYLVDTGSLPPHEACTLACAGLTAYSALKKVGRLPEGSALLIVGAGGVGLTAVRLAKAVTGVAPIVADIDPAKREAALAAGAASVVDPREADAGRKLVKETGGLAAAVDFAGAKATFDFAYGALRKGGQLVMVGLLGGAAELSLPLLIMRAVGIRGSYVGSLEELKELVALMQAGQAAPIPVSPRPLAQANAALDDLRAGRVTGRTVLTP